MTRSTTAALAVLLLAVLFPFGAWAQQAMNVPDAEQLVGAPAGQPLTGAALSQKTQEVAGEIRCPVCQGLSIADSPSEMAINMKAQVKALLARGYTREQIDKYFELSYGQFVLLKPKFQGVNTLVWLLPLLALGAGIWLVATKLRKLETTPAPDTKAAAEPAKKKAAKPSDADDEYVARVRAMVKEGKR